jgi:hypothetical protein
MKLRFTLFLSILFCLALAVIPASASTLWYDNGAPSTNRVPYLVSGENMVSDWFSCPGTSCTIDTLVFSGYPQGPNQPTKISGTITDYIFGWGTTTYGSFTDATVQVGSCDSNFCQYTVDLSGFNLSGLPPGTDLFLNLTGADQPLRWNTSGTAWNYAAYLQANGIFLDGIVGESFQLYGTTDPVPEPSSFLMLGSGLIGLAGMLRRKLGR